MPVVSQDEAHVPPGNDKRDLKAFWGEVYETAYAASDAELDGVSLDRSLEALEDMFRRRAHLAVTEMPFADLAGRRVLEIGCGSGGHSALFARRGAEMVSIDITFERASATARKFALLGERADASAAAQADAESLPFPEGSFDIVYSNGVLHHTSDTERAVAEVLRVLKPGGTAVIMLYCKSSAHYWFDLWFCVGLLKGAMFRSTDWLGHATEWIGFVPQTAVNPITRCYWRRGIERLFRRFEGVSARKSEFYFYLIPKLGRLYRRWQIRHYGVHPGGMLVYGAPWPMVSPLEHRLGRVIGWCWNVRAQKPERPA